MRLGARCGFCSYCQQRGAEPDRAQSAADSTPNHAEAPDVECIVLFHHSLSLDVGHAAKQSQYVPRQPVIIGFTSAAIDPTPQARPTFYYLPAA